MTTIFSTATLAKHVGVTRARVNRAYDEGWLPGMKFGGKLLRFRSDAITPEMLQRLQSGHQSTVELKGRQHVYFIAAASGPIKIGVAIHPHARLFELQVAHFEEITLLGFAEGGPVLERDLHRKFKHLRIRGEWFERHPDILAEISRLTDFVEPIQGASA